MTYSKSEITELLRAWSDGEPEALEVLMPLIFDDVRDIAQRYLKREAQWHTLQPTALVNEVYLRLIQRRSVEWKNRAHFLGAMAEMVRRILVDHARRRLAEKRGRGAVKVIFEEDLFPPLERPADLVALDDALEVLNALHERQCETVKLKFFMGLTREEIASVLGVSVTTVIRDWANARVFLLRELQKDSPETTNLGEDSDS